METRLKEKGAVVVNVDPDRRQRLLMSRRLTDEDTLSGYPHSAPERSD